jgi:hypothetical protein
VADTTGQFQCLEGHSHTQNGSSYLQLLSFELTIACSFQFPIYRGFIPSRSLYIRHKQANQEGKHNKATDRYTRIFLALHKSSNVCQVWLTPRWCMWNVNA